MAGNNAPNNPPSTHTGTLQKATQDAGIGQRADTHTWPAQQANDYHNQVDWLTQQQQKK